MRRPVEDIREAWSPHVYHTFNAQQITDDFQVLFAALDNWVQMARFYQEELEKVQAELKELQRG
jgi:hypothetical protein